jgi:hypothetical protein
VRPAQLVQLRLKRSNMRIDALWGRPTPVFHRKPTARSCTGSRSGTSASLARRAWAYARRPVPPLPGEAEEAVEEEAATVPLPLHVRVWLGHHTEESVSSRGPRSWRPVGWAARLGNGKQQRTSRVIASTHQEERAAIRRGAEQR